MTNFAKVKDEKGLIRDMYSKGVLSIDENALLEHRKNKQLMKTVFENNQRIDKLETDIEFIKNMLIKLVRENND